MPGLPKADDVIAVFASDIHLCHTPPVAREHEPNWYDAMLRPVMQLQAIVDETGAALFYAGDIFDRWNAPAELINWALAYLPPGWAIPGQHDLPQHNYGDIRRSAYWTLVAAGKLVNMIPGDPYRTNGWAFYGYPWKHPIVPLHANEHTCAIVHAYIWGEGSGYKDAPEEQRITAYASQLEGYDVAVFGDNHIGFLGQCGATRVLNNGGFMRRRTDEVHYRPHVGLLLRDGTVIRRELDCTEDILTVNADIKIMEFAAEIGGAADFIRELGALGAGGGMDFREAVRQYCNTQTISDRARKALLSSIGD